jgi:hypothetical protein
MSQPAVSAIDIDHKLHDDFRRRVAEYGIQVQAFDPVLSVLFRTFAQQLETLYADTGRIRLALLDELIAGLGIERRSARPAQTVVRFVTGSELEFVNAGTALSGTTPSGERIVFRTDVPVNVSPVRVALIAAYEGGALQLAAPATLEEQMQAVRPALDPVRVNLGPNPALYLAFDHLTREHLSRHSLFFDITPDGKQLQNALEWEPWCLMDSAGALSSTGLLRSTAVSGAVRQLRWLLDSRNGTGDPGVSPHIGGFYGSRTFVFPEIAPGRRFTCTMPPRLEPPLQKIFGRNTAQLFDQPRAWVRIPLPKHCSGIQRLIAGIVPNATTASNVECINQTIYFDKHGTSVPVSSEAGTAKHLVAPLSVIGESGNAYCSDMQPVAEHAAGRYAIRNGRIDLRPGLLANGQPEGYANLRMLVTTGSVGNTVGPGSTQTFESGDNIKAVTVVNPTSAAGGSDQENFEHAQLRFHGALLSRDRIVTHEDLLSAVRTFDRRILEVDSATAAMRSPRGLQRVQSITIALDRDDFSNPDEESRFLEQELTAFLAGRVMYGLELRVRTRWS